MRRAPAPYVEEETSGCSFRKKVQKNPRQGLNRRTDEPQKPQEYRNETSSHTSDFLLFLRFSILRFKLVQSRSEPPLSACDMGVPLLSSGQLSES